MTTIILYLCIYTAPNGYPFKAVAAEMKDAQQVAKEDCEKAVPAVNACMFKSCERIQQ